jgi:beta-glucanase (GH16 family)
MCIPWCKKDPRPIASKLDLTGYDLIHRDEFDKTPIDWTKWTHTLPGGQDQKNITKWVPENVIQDSEGVHLIATSGGPVNLCGQLTTYPFLETLYGYTYFVAKMPPNGLLYWPALWGYNLKGWQPEIDIVELVGEKSNELWFTHHYLLPPDLVTDHAVGTRLLFPKTNFDQGFHEYGILWEPNRLTWYVDKMPYFTTTENIPNVPLFWLMSIGVGGYAPYTYLIKPEEEGKGMTIKNWGIWQK